MVLFAASGLFVLSVWSAFILSLISVVGSAGLIVGLWTFCGNFWIGSFGWLLTSLFLALTCGHFMVRSALAFEGDLHSWGGL